MPLHHCPCVNTEDSYRHREAMFGPWGTTSWQKHHNAHSNLTEESSTPDWASSLKGRKPKIVPQSWSRSCCWKQPVYSSQINAPGGSAGMRWAPSTNKRSAGMPWAPSTTGSCSCAKRYNSIKDASQGLEKELRRQSACLANVKTWVPSPECTF